VIKNETRPAVELCTEKKLDSFGRFTRGKCVNANLLSRRI
jgi:hypothetical protein